MAVIILAILVGKLTSFITKTLHLGGGSAAPGLYALKVYPELVQGLASKIPQNVVITGTNGKTTTARMLAHFAQDQDLKVIRNATGSNLERGIASTLISRSHILSGKLKNFDLGIWELDEAAFNSVVSKLKPDLVVFLNVSRDQLDRYGEVDNVVNSWCQTLKSLPKSTQVILNSDDDKVRSLSKCFSGKSTTFSLDQAADIISNGLMGSEFKIKNFKSKINLPLPGLYHVSDFLSAFAAGIQLRLDPQKMADSLKDFTPAFGRVERFSLQPRGLLPKTDGYILLIKNPAGATQVLQTVASELKPNDRLLIALNDNLADGTDVSWIWDMELEQLLTSHISHITCSGSRAEDLAVRLKYAGMAISRIEVEKDLFQALQRARDGLKGRLFILPTYTALLELQGILAKMGVKDHYWRE